ncbi:hypothetical protein BHY_0462 [Borrelia nietonii YOR]|uniref:Uncharacterized protein n=1 Tax=Borrelia nietonii YOR TaxID=1293576 RepID=A0ABM5PIH8_9SPIR|nr:hypothetical protein BHY_0462 [Borrelia nietonii YOR]AHH13925.1 hypothetical protein BHW_0900080 [Borrelia hermsii MTW]
MQIMLVETACKRGFAFTKNFKHRSFKDKQRFDLYN